MNVYIIFGIYRDVKNQSFAVLSEDKSGLEEDSELMTGKLSIEGRVRSFFYFGTFIIYSPCRFIRRRNFYFKKEVYKI